MNTRSQGNLGEDRAQEFLTSKGFKILTRNFRSKFGEIDIIAKDKNCIVFIEVKMRSSNVFGTPREAITSKKLEKIALTAAFYLKSINAEKSQYRIDAIEVEQNSDQFHFNHIENVTM